MPYFSQTHLLACLMITLSSGGVLSQAFAGESEVASAAIRSALESSGGKALLARALENPESANTIGRFLGISDLSILSRSPEAARRQILAKLRLSTSESGTDHELAAEIGRLLGIGEGQPRSVVSTGLPHSAVAAIPQASEVGGVLNFERGTRREASSVVQVEVDPQEAPPFRTQELWVLDNQLAATKQRIEQYEAMLKEGSDLEPYWHLDPEERKGAPKKTGLSDEHRGIVKRVLTSLKAQKKELESKIEARKEIDRARLLPLAKESLKEPSGQELADEFVFLSKLMSVPSERTTSVLAGNPFEAPTAQQVARIQDLVRGLVARGKFIVHDGDSQMAPHIAAAAGSHQLAVTERSLPNMYLRLMAFEHASTSVLSPESLAAQALRVRRKGTVMLSQDKDEAKLAQKLYFWTKRLTKSQINLGADVGGIPTALTPKKALFAKDASGRMAFAATLDPIPGPEEYTLDTLPYDGLESLLAYSDEMRRGAEKLKKVDGAVVFGSAKMSGFNRLIYDTTKELARLGINIVTGGAGGAMRVANTAAWDAGVESVGVPIGGRNQLVSESTVFAEVQSVTFVTSDYPTRIPLLLNNRRLVVFVPGGNGTLRELAAVLLQYASADMKASVLFESTDYYRELYDYLQELPLPAEAKSRFLIANGPNATRELVLQEMASGRIERRGLVQKQYSLPRTKANSFPKNPKNPVAPWLKGWKNSE